MTDTTAAFAALGLLTLAAMAYSHRQVLQPTRSAAAAYLVGTFAWGIAVVAVWIAWAGSTSIDSCPDEPCDAVVESIEGHTGANEEVLLSQDVIGELTD